MSQSNSSFLRGYFEEVVNQKNRLDMYSKYIDEKFSKKFSGHVPLYISLGIMCDDSSGKVIIQAINLGSPAASELKVGDEILHVFDGERLWISFDELREGKWGQGAFGTTLTVWVRRKNEEHEFSLIRGLIQGFEFPYHLYVPNIIEYFKDWTDLKARLVSVIENGDLIAYHAEFCGYNVLHRRSAIWEEFGFVRFQGGKITDWWCEEDKLSQLIQLGYTIHEPELV
jgi:hypothetical protein